MSLSPQRVAPKGYRKRIEYDCCDYDPDPENGPETDGPQQMEDEDEDTWWDRRNEWIQETRQVVQPEPDVCVTLQ